MLWITVKDPSDRLWNRSQAEDADNEAYGDRCHANVVVYSVVQASRSASSCCRWTRACAWNLTQSSQSPGLPAQIINSLRWISCFLIYSRAINDSRSDPDLPADLSSRAWRSMAVLAPLYSAILWTTWVRSPVFSIAFWWSQMQH